MDESITKFVEVPFLGTQVQVVDSEEHYIPLKPLVEGIGLKWKNIHKVFQRSVLSSVGSMMETTGSDGKKYQMECLPLKHLQGFLFLVDPNQYDHNPELKQKLINYQLKCSEVLHDYFTKGYVMTDELEKKLKTVIIGLKKQSEGLKTLLVQKTMEFSHYKQEAERKGIFVPDDAQYGSKSKINGKKRTLYRQGYYVSEGGKTVPLSTADYVVDLVDFVNMELAMQECECFDPKLLEDI